ALGLVTFLGIWWGALVNRFRIQVREVNIEMTGLPDSFDGYRIAQLSDLHVGTYGNDTTFIHDLVEKVNSLNPNLIVFTGDIVNRTTSELVPFVRPFSRLNAPDGVISILGNHDYGDYYNWPSQNAKEQNLEWLMDLQIEMGWELLTNSSTVIYGQSASDSLVIVGVENWGDPPFPTYGDLDQAYSTPGDSVTKILLTHNPAHWISCIAPVDTMRFGLTLSGHTHAMQMEIAGFSPAVWRYRTWGGLYQTDDNERPLYVNIGAGTVGVPMRLGATPEITLFTITPRRNNK
ncbi:MAG: metallophosphoesterase, partial [Muribaculaceae bacterium]|nr:metallophosphoesterase [Muribaculaceae bacterium]